MRKIKIFALILSLMLTAGSAYAREETQNNDDNPAGIVNLPHMPEVADSNATLMYSMVDSSLVGKLIFDILPCRDDGDGIDVSLRQSDIIGKAMSEYISSGRESIINGYRVRIYFDNKQNSRNASSAVKKQFEGKYPDIPAYRSYTNPFFKVTVGDYRTRSEAMRLFTRIKADFPTAFVVKDEINYPL